ncbi:hypothetical protein [Nocardioides nitrophenolicus]|uniref:hypothetical protein n=1 Tax=Nocardioides nitrophenolicus TaxID=60489 RepID=UPI00195D2982|nr:hypothetical protein [Nocardioides nitrophenolicus]MBM7519033.1 hypothetical protein [Nocardioides nitrophenolicus]
MKVLDPQGRTWRVTRRWLPWRPRRRYLGPSLNLDVVDGLVGFLVALVFGLVVLPIASFVFLTGGELVLLVVLLPAVTLGRVLFGRHWWIEARLGFRPYWETEAGDWKESGRRIRAVAESIERGDPPMRTLGEQEPEPTRPTPYDPPGEGA